MKIIKISGKICMALMVFCLVSCDRDAIYNEELYKTVVYLLSGTQNIYTESYTLKENEPVKYISVGVGGSNANTQEISVVLDEDNNDLFNKYNRDNFDINTEAYARLLPASRYRILAYTVSIPAGATEQYARVPVVVNPHGLSPDSTYFIPMVIKSLNRYEVNEEKKNMLFRVTIENEYARQQVLTQYVKKGEIREQSRPEYPVTLSGSKVLQPLTKNKVRLFVGNYIQNQNTTVADIERYAIVVNVNEDNTIDFTPYGTIEVEKLELKDYNIYDPNVLQGTKIQRVFYMYYRYRIMGTNGVYGEWMIARETLTRVEED